MSELPPILIQNISEIYGAKGKNWLNHLPESITKLSVSWDFTFLNILDNLPKVLTPKLHSFKKRLISLYHKT